MINQQPNEILIFLFHGSGENYKHSVETVLGSLFGGSSRRVATCIPLTKDRSSSIGNGRPLRSSM